MEKELPEIMEKFLINLKKRSRRSDKTIEAYRKNLRVFTETMFNNREPNIEDYEKLTVEDFGDWVDLQNDLSAATINQRLATLKKFYSYLMGQKIVTVNTPRQFGTLKTEELYERPILNEDETKQLIKYAREEAIRQESYNGYRNEMIVNLFLATGLRIEELYKISVDDINLETGEFTVVGKRNKKRTIFLPKSKLIMLEGYLKIRNLQKHREDSALFLSRQATDGGYRLGIDQIRKIVVSLAKGAGVKKITPHSLRHTGATLQIKNGANLLDVSQWLGHSTISITEKIYVHQTNESACRVANIFDGMF